MPKYIYSWDRADNPRNSNLIAKLQDVGVITNLQPINKKVITDLLDFYNPESSEMQIAVFTTNDPELLSNTEHCLLTTMCLTYGLSVNLLSPQLLFDSLKQRTGDEPRYIDIYSGSFVVLSEIDKPLKVLEYHKGSLSALFKRWIENRAMVLVTSTYRESFSEKSRTFLDTIGYYYGDIAYNLMKNKATYFTYHEDGRKSIVFKKIG